MISEGIGHRLEAAQRLLKNQGVDVLLVAPSSDLVYLTGYGAHATERPTLLAVRPEGQPFLLVPELEAPRASTLGLPLVTYNETESPYGRLAQALGAIQGRAAISDQAWAGVLLGLQHALDLPFQSASPLIRELRMRKDQDELAALERAGALADAAFVRLLGQASFAGQTERELANQLRDLMRDEGLQVTEWGPIVASGPNSASPHHMTGDRTIQRGDAVVMDFGGSINGYHSDITRTVHVGEPSDRYREVYGVVRRAQQAGVEAARAGIPTGEVDRVTRGVIEEAGYGPYFIHRTGHGLGLDLHEEPFIVQGNSLPLEPGMVHSVEPGIYLPDEFGVRIEDIVVVTTGEAQRLNNAPRDLTVVE